MKNILRNVLCGAAVLIATHGNTALGYTLDEIFSGSQQITAIESKQYSYVFETNIAQRDPNVTTKYNGSFGVTMERVPGSDTKVKISGICFTAYDTESTFSFIFTLSENGTENANGSQLILGKNEVSPDDNKTKLQCMKINHTYDWWYGDTYSYADANTDLILNITKNNDDSFHFESETYSVYLNSPTLSSPTFLGGTTHFTTESLEFDTYKSNKIATETFDHWKLESYNNASAVNDYSKTRTYPLAVDMNYDTKVCTIKNFANQGFMLNNAGLQSNLVGTINPTEKTITFKNTPGYIQQAKYSEYSANGPWILYALEYRLCTWTGVDGGAVTEGAVAKYDDRDEVHHNDVDHAWVTNNGKRRTWGSETIWFEKPILFFNNTKGPHSSGTIPMDFGTGFKGWNFGQYVPRATAVYRDLTIGDDVTLDIDLALNHYGVDENNVYVNATLTENKNYENVDHYELWMVPGKYASINDAGFTHHLDNGHINGVCISDFTSDWTPKANIMKAAAAARPTGGVGTHTFNIVVPAEEIGGTDETKGYTFFVKAIYKDKNYYNASEDLTPTFHNLTYKETTTTGVGGIEADASDNTPRYYNLNGIEVNESNLVPGIYLKREGAKTTKIVVK